MMGEVSAGSVMGEVSEELPLPSLFERAQDLHSLAVSSQIDREQLNDACRLLEQCQEKIGRLGLFSANEDKEDISTADLKYLLVPYYLGELIEKLTQGERLHVIQASKVQLLTFVRSCDRLELVPGGEVESLTREFPPDAETRRSEKVARFKRQKQAETKLQEILERKERRHRSAQAAAIAATVEHGEEDPPDGDEEEEREARFAQISICLCKALDLLEMLRREEEMLISFQQTTSKGGQELLSRMVLDERHARAESWHKEAASKARAFRPVNTLATANLVQDVLEGRASSAGHQHSHMPVMFGPASVIGSSLGSDRQKIVAEVFQPSHRLPTMSIEEAGLKEMQMMKTWNERNAKLQEEANSSWFETSNADDEDNEAAEYKARAWDDWKDENPRGAGNKKLTPCG